MRLKRAVIIQFVDRDDELELSFTIGTGHGSISVALPAAWGAMARAERIEWAKEQIRDHLAHSDEIHAAPYEAVYPDCAAPDRARDNFGALAGWASWTPDEARTWIAENVLDLATAKHVIGEMAAAIMMLRDIVIER